MEIRGIPITDIFCLLVIDMWKYEKALFIGLLALLIILINAFIYAIESLFLVKTFHRSLEIEKRMPDLYSLYKSQGIAGDVALFALYTRAARKPEFAELIFPDLDFGLLKPWQRKYIFLYQRPSTILSFICAGVMVIAYQFVDKT